MRARPRHLGVLGALGALAIGLGGCGVPTSPIAVGLPPNLTVPPQGGSTTTTPTTTTEPPKVPSSKELQVYLVRRDGHLVPVPRPWTATKLTPTVAVGLLAGPPTASEKNLTNAVPSSPQVKIVVNHSLARVNLDYASFSTLFGPTLYTALAQIVYTLISHVAFHINAIDFRLSGEGFGPIPYNYTPSGATVNHPVTKSTYAALAPLPVKEPSSSKKAKG